MKIFIWEEVLTDHTDGMAVAYAKTLEEALNTFDEDYISKQLGIPTHIIDCETNKKPAAFYVYGGG